jgi:hypothetical protein
MDECMRINKPCKFEGLAKSWPGYTEWRFASVEGKPYDQLEMLIGGNTIMDVFIDMDPDAFIDISP